MGRAKIEDTSLPSRLGHQDRLIKFEYRNLTFKELVKDQELVIAYQLRYRIVVKKLHWVEGDPVAEMEHDEFDPYSYHFGCYRGTKLIGYMRMTKETSPAGTMSRKYFGHLWHKPVPYPKDETADISRLIVDVDDLPTRKQLPTILLGLYRLAYGRSHLCRPVIRYWYFVTAPRLVRGLRWRMGLPVKLFGKGTTSDGKVSLIAGLDLKSAKRRLLFVAPWRLRFFARAKRHIEPRDW